MDRARVQVGRISRFGLLEMSRQRLRPSLGETSSKVCPRCLGHGSIRSTKSIALSILRLVEEEAQKERSAEIRAITPISVATFLLNEKRKSISNIETRNNTRVVIVPSENLVTPHFEVQRLRDDEAANAETSYNIVGVSDESVIEEDVTARPAGPASKPVVQQLQPAEMAPAPMPAAKREPEPVVQLVNKPGLWTRLLRNLFGDPEEEARIEQEKEEAERRKQRQSRNQRERDSRNRQGGRNQRGNRRRNDNRGPSADQSSGESGNDNTNREGRDNRSSRRRKQGQAPQKQDEAARIAEDNRAGSDDTPEATPGPSDRPARRPANKRGKSQPRRRGRRNNAEPEAATDKVEVAELNQQVAEAIDAKSEAQESGASSETAISKAGQQRTKASSKATTDADTRAVANGEAKRNMASDTGNTATLAAADSAAQSPVTTPGGNSRSVQSASNSQAELPLEQTDIASAPSEPAAPAQENTSDVNQMPEPVAEELTVSEAKAAAEPQVNEPEVSSQPYERASNDPRINPRPVINAEIKTVETTVQMSGPLDTTRAANITHNPRPLPRPANDPRLKRGAPRGLAEAEAE